MGKNKCKKWLLPLAIGVVLLSGGRLVHENLIVHADVVNSNITPVVFSASHSVVTINNTQLNVAIRKLLGKSNSDKLYADDFLTHVDFKPTITTDEQSGITVTTAKTYQLDLSGTGVTDIRELCKFAFPETLKGINLSGNGITNAHLANIVNLISASEGSSVEIDEENILTSACNFSSIIKKVNLNDNNIDLERVGVNYLENVKLLFGIQNFAPIHSSGFVLSSELDPMYYIRKDDVDVLGDEHFLSFSFVFEYSTEINSVLRKVYDTPTRLLDLSSYDREFGHLAISVTSIPETETAYFGEYSFNRDFYLINVHMDEDFRVERKSLLNLNIVKGELTADCPLIVEGLGSSLYIEYDNASTSKITKIGDNEHRNYVNITLKYKGSSRTIPVEFVVQDTVAPVINLVGGEYVYSRKGREFKDPGYIAFDPAMKGDKSGDDVSVVVTGSINITSLGKYQLTYTAVDDADNKTIVTRTVEIQESVLDELTIKTNNLKLTIDDDVIVIVEPNTIKNYNNITYYWYLNNTLMDETKAGSNGTGVKTFNISDVGLHEVKVKLVATYGAGSEQKTIEVWSGVLEINIERLHRNNDTLILSVGIAIGIIILVIVIIALNKYRKGKKTITGKHKNFHKGKLSKNKNKKEDTGPEIQVIKNYNGSTGTDTGTGGNQSFRMPESNGGSNSDKGMDR